MKLIKLTLALALFTSSLSFKEQVLVTKQGLVSNWEIQVGATTSFALIEANQFE